LAQDNKGQVTKIQTGTKEAKQIIVTTIPRGYRDSFVPGDAPDWYLQFMEKNTKKYAATGGWGYSNFDKDLKPLTDEKIMYACYTCHQAVEDRDYIFTKYAP
jgi:hypothetical protein